MSGDEASAAALPVAALDRAFERLKSFDRVVLAVSGGADSTALLHLVADWRARTPDVRSAILVVTVDHGVRAGSAAEAAAVAKVAASRGLPHLVVRSKDPPPAGLFSQAWARELRYRLLAEAATRDMPPGAAAAIVTAHHRDDQAETVLMRLARGTGIDGLGAIRPETRLQAAADVELVLMRPLLDFPRAALCTYLVAHGLTWIDDPSNAMSRFERVRLRERCAARDALGLADDKLALTAARARRASAALDAILLRTLDAAAETDFHLSDLGYATIGRAWFERLEPELRLRLLIRLLHALGGQDRPVSLGALEAQGSRILGPRLSQQGFTLHGTEVHLDGDPVLITREPLDARQPLETLPARLGALPLPPGATVRWDNRFILTLAPGAPAGLSVGPLCAGGLSALEKSGWKRPGTPARVLWALPAIRSLNSVLALPGADFLGSGFDPGWLRCRFDRDRFRARPTRLG